MVSGWTLDTLQWIVVSFRSRYDPVMARFEDLPPDELPDDSHAHFHCLSCLRSKRKEQVRSVREGERRGQRRREGEEREGEKEREGEEARGGERERREGGREKGRAG